MEEKSPTKEKTRKEKKKWAKPFVDFQILKPQVVRIKKKQLPKIIAQQAEDWDEWLESVRNVDDEWMKRRIDPAIQKLKEKISSIWKKEEDFVAEKEVSSLKEFATQFVIQGKAGFAPRDF